MKRREKGGKAGERPHVCTAGIHMPARHSLFINERSPYLDGFFFV
jgi:hypothetical protein